MAYRFDLPSLASLTLPQRSAVSDTNPIALMGGPGTGKSVVSLYRHLNNYDNGVKSLLLTYTTTLKLYLQSCCRLKNETASQNTQTTYHALYTLRSNYDEIIVDEAQDIEIGKYDTIKEHAGKVSYGADEKQSLYSGASCEQLRRKFSSNRTHILDKNFRNTKCILKLCMKLFPYSNISMQEIESCRINGNLPDLFVFNDWDWDTRSSNKQNEAIVELVGSKAREAGHNIAILCPFSNNVEYFYTLLKQRFSGVTYYYSRGNTEVGCQEIGHIHVTTFKSAKGLEFDTVIIPNFDSVNQDLSSFNTSWKDFYVGVTRSRTNLHLLSRNSISQIEGFVNKQTI